MLDNTQNSENLSIPSPFNTMPDPWDAEVIRTPQTVSRQFPLDPGHEISACPTADKLLSPEGDPTALQLTQASAETYAAKLLLLDELKVQASQAKGLWDHIRDFLALLWWGGFQDELST